MNDFLDALHVELGATATEILKEETGLDKLPLSMIFHLQNKG